MRRGKFQVFQDDAGEWRWRLKAANGEVVAQSESYGVSHSNAVRGAKDARRAARLAKVES